MKWHQRKEQPLKEYQCEVTGPPDVHAFIQTQLVQRGTRHDLGQRCLQGD